MAAFGLFAVLTITLAAHHQPWRDEADAWLMARDASVADLFRSAGYSGTPALWYLIQVPFAKAGAPYATQLRGQCSAVIDSLKRPPKGFFMPLDSVT